MRPLGGCSGVQGRRDGGRGMRDFAAARPGERTFYWRAPCLVKQITLECAQMDLSGGGALWTSDAPRRLSFPSRQIPRQCHSMDRWRLATPPRPPSEPPLVLPPRCIHTSGFPCRCGCACVVWCVTRFCDTPRIRRRRFVTRLDVRVRVCVCIGTGLASPRSPPRRRP
jgi:hypothetical protein